MLLQLPGLPAVGGGSAADAFARGRGPTNPVRGDTRRWRRAWPGGRLLAALALAAVLAGTGRPVAAQEDGRVEFTERDYAAYLRLRLADAVAQEKLTFAHGNPAKETATKAEFAKECAAVGWTQERFAQVDEAVASAVSAIADPENASDEVSQTTLATVKAHRLELENTDEVHQQARRLIQTEELAAKRGAPPTPAQLAGRWVFDVDRTVANMMPGMGDEEKRNAREALTKSMIAGSYVFGPGNRLVATVVRPGKPPDTQAGTYRLEGTTLIIQSKLGDRMREDKVDVGIRDGCLQIGMMGVFSVFRRE